MYYGLQDKRKMEYMIQKEATDETRFGDPEVKLKAAMDAFSKVTEYCEASTCRRVKLLEYFGDPILGSKAPQLCAHASECCDVCKHPQRVTRALDDFRSVGDGTSHGRGFGSGVNFRPLAEAIEGAFWDNEDGEGDDGERREEEDDISCSDGERLILS